MIAKRRLDNRTAADAYLDGALARPTARLELPVARPPARYELADALNNPRLAAQADQPHAEQTKQAKQAKLARPADSELRSVAANLPDVVVPGSVDSSMMRKPRPPAVSSLSISADQQSSRLLRDKISREIDKSFSLRRLPADANQTFDDAAALG